MRKYALLGLALMLCCFISGGVYIISTIFAINDKLEKVVVLHQVEFFRENLTHHTKASQSNLLLQGTPHTRDVETTVQYVEAVESATEKCFSCHHAEATEKKLEILKMKVSQYMSLISRSMTIRANQQRLDFARIQAFTQGENVLKEINSLSIDSANKISNRIGKIRADIHATNYFLIACIIIGPIAIVFITLFFLRRFTGSIDTLVEANRMLESGDLNYRIQTPLKNEFKTLAKAFNRMVDALNDERHKFESMNTLYHTLFESAGDAILLTDMAEVSMGRIVSANPAAAKLYGYSVDELLGMNIVDLVPVTKEEKFRVQFKTFHNGEWTRSRIKGRRKDGSLIPVDLSLGMLQLDEKRYLLSFCKDISDLLRDEEELQRANQMALVGQMAAGLAHEIKNPLAGIKISLDVLSDELDLKDDDKELFVRIINEINRMERLLKSLLSYARPPQPQLDLLDINRLLNSSIKNMEMTAGHEHQNKVQFVKDFQSDLPQVEVDSSQLQQIFLNIYLNALDAMEDGGTITTRTRMEGVEHVQVEISDTGKGMPAASLEKIFTPFFTTKTKGTGLGLAICKRLIEQHGGSIQVISLPGEGTSFVSLIPVIQATGSELYG